MTQPNDPRRALLTAALATAERGWPVFPLRPGQKRPALHGETRCPRTGTCATGHVKWEQRATTNPARITAAWATGAYNIGIATGPANLVVIDLDMPKPHEPKDTPSGVTTFTALCERAGQTVPTTRTVRTASGGQHLYFSAPAAARLSSTAGTLAPHVDTRAWGGYVVAAGSIIDNTAYATAGPALIRPLPGWLMQVLIPAPRRPDNATATPVKSRSGYAAAALRAELDNVTRAPEGTRNDTLLRAARAIGRFVAWGEIPRPDVEDAFQTGGESAGLSATECRATIRSALDWSIRTARPREAA